MFIPKRAKKQASMSKLFSYINYADHEDNFVTKTNYCTTHFINASIHNSKTVHRELNLNCQLLKKTFAKEI